MRAGWALRQFPFVAEQVFKESNCSTLSASCVQVTSRPLVIVSPPLPVPKLFFQPRPCASSPAASGSAPTWVAGRGAVGLAEGMTAGDERHGFFVVHGHAREGFANITRRGDRIRIAVGTFRD